MPEQSPIFKAINEAYPHIGERLKLYWGTKQFLIYMDSLQHDTRGGKRKGFPAKVLFALHDLSEHHAQAHPHLLPGHNVWSYG